MAGDGEVAAWVAGYLDEDSLVGAAFVQLACGVEVARAVAEGGGDPEGIANGKAGVEEKLFVLSDAGDVGEEGHVVARIDGAEEGMQGAVQGAFGACAGKGFVVAVEGDAVGENGCDFGEFAFFLVCVEQALGVVFAFPDIGLVVGVDAEDVAGDGYGKLPAEELGPEASLEGRTRRTTGWPAASSFSMAVLLVHVSVVFEGEIDEEAVFTIGRRTAHGLARDGHKAFALFAGAFGNQLLYPEAEAVEIGRGEDGDFVTAHFAGFGQYDAEPHAGIGIGGRIRAAGAGHVRRTGEDGVRYRRP